MTQRRGYDPQGTGITLAAPPGGLRRDANHRAADPWAAKARTPAHAGSVTPASLAPITPLRLARTRLLLSAIALLVAEAAAAATWQGRVSAVHDGDTLTVQRRAGSVLVRLVHIDAPESDQPFGLESRRGLQRLVRLEEVRVTTAGRDRYGRTLGTVTRTRDGLNVNLAQVEHGFAWAYARGSAGLAFDRAERAARAARRGLWADPSPVRPSEWRRRRRGASTRR